MTKITQNRGRQGLRLSLLTGASGALLASFAATPALADDATVNGGVATVNGVVVSSGVQNNGGNIGATANNAAIGIIVENESGTTSNVVSANTIGAASLANTINQSADLNLIGDLPDDGISSLVFQNNSGVVTSVASNNEIESLLGGLPAAATHDGNRISARTTVNSSETELTGDVPTGYDSALIGDSLIIDTGAAGGGYSQAEGSISALTVQGNEGAGSAATAENNSISLVVDTQGTLITDSVEAALSVDGNQVSADYESNVASTNITIGSGDSPVFAGSASLTNYQYDGTDAHAGGRNAANLGTVISGSVGNSGLTQAAALGGSLSVSDNEVSASATGNSALGDVNGAGNRIVLESGLSFEGAGTTGDSGAFVTPGGVIIGGDADLILTSAQRNIDSAWLNARTEGTRISASVQEPQGATVDLSGNLIQTSTNGNEASSAILNEGTAASFAGTAAVVNYQSNVDGATRAVTEDTRIGAGFGQVLPGVNLDDNVVTVDANEVRAIATGNNSAQMLDLDAVLLDIGTGPAEFGATVPLPIVSESNGGATVTNIQINDNAPISALNIISSITLQGITGNGVALRDSEFSVDGNVQEAIAAGNIANSDLLLNGNDVGSGAGISSLQYNDFDADVLARFRGDASIDLGYNNVSNDVSLSGNQQYAVASGNAVDNDASVDANNVELAAALLGVTASTLDDAVLFTSAGYAVQNAQVQLGDVVAEVFSNDALLDGGSLLDVDMAFRFRLGSNLAVDDNIVGARAYGNDGSNNLSVDANSLTVATDAHANAAAVTNGQTLAGDVTAEVNPEGSAVSVNIAGVVEQGASLSVSENMFGATAIGNRILANQLDVDGNDIVVAAGANDQRGSATSDSVVEVNAAFAVQNGQVTTGTVGAALGSDDGDDADILVNLGRDVTSATIAVDGNEFAAAAIANRGSSALNLEANNLQATAGVQNYQVLDGNVGAISGGEGSGISVNAGSAGFNLVSGTAVSLSENVRSATAIGNDGVASLDVTGNTITAAGNNLAASANDEGAFGDFVLGNDQEAYDGEIFALAAGTIEFDNLLDTNVVGSSIDVIGNVQTAEAVANRGANSLAVQGTNIVQNGDYSANSALYSYQNGEGVDAQAQSFLAIATPVEVENSSVDISGNVNTARSFVNTVENVITISATNLAGGALGEADVLGGSNEGTATADHVLVNNQLAAGGLVSEASTQIGDNDDGNEGIANSSINISNNVTVAEATANRAINTASVTGLANNGATAAVANWQSSSASVGVTATTNAGVSAAGDGIAALGNSGIALNNNRTAATAAGNVAANTLNYAGGTLAPTGTGANVSFGSGGDFTAAAPALVLNGQNNSGAVSANATATHNVALNGLGAGGVVAGGSTVAVTGNTANAAAFGNYAVNTLSITGLNSGAAGAVANVQNNSGAISATATGSSITIGAPTGTVVGSSLGVTGNTIGATAVGNSASNVIGR